MAYYDRTMSNRGIIVSSASMNKLAHGNAEPLQSNHWKLDVSIHIDDVSSAFHVENIFQVEVTGSTHIGSLIVKIVEPLEKRGLRYDWSKYAIWWPLKNQWLLKTKCTVDQYGLQANEKIKFIKTHKNIRIQMPDFNVVETAIDFSATLFQTVINLCKKIELKNPEEVSLMKIAPVEAVVPDVSDNKSEDEISLHSRDDNKLTVSATLSRHSIASLSKNLTLDTSASEARDTLVTNRNNLDIHELMRKMGIRNKNAQEKSYLNQFWLDSSKSLMEQNVNENDLLHLRFKYFSFYNLNAENDSVRVNQLYEQAKFSILSDEINCTEDELIHFAALQLQIYIQTKVMSETVSMKKSVYKPVNIETNIDDELDKLMAQLELPLDYDNTIKTTKVAKPAAAMTEIGEELEIMNAKQTFKKFKKFYAQLKETFISYYTSKEELVTKSAPIERFNLNGAQVLPEFDVDENKFSVLLKIPAEGSSQKEIIVRFGNQQSFAKWLAAFKLVSKNKTIADFDAYQFEVLTINSLMEIQRKPNGTLRGSINKNTDYFDVRNFATKSLFKKYKPKQLTDKIINVHSNYTSYNLLESRLKYIKNWQVLPSFGITYFHVNFRVPSNKLREGILGVTPNGLAHVNSHDGTVQGKWNFNNMKTWSINWETGEFEIQFDNEVMKLTCVDKVNPKILHEYIGGYIFMSIRKSGPLDTQLFFSLTNKR